MKILKKVLLLILSLMAVLFIAALWYVNTYSMDKAKAFEVHSPSLERKLLIATQGSDFKYAVTSGIVENYELDSLFIKVIDVSDLGKVRAEEFNAIVIIHTWENWKPPRTVLAFTNKNRKHKEKVIYLTTSGDGSYKMGDVDAIAGESILEEAPRFTDRIIEKLDSLLKIRKGI